MKITTGRDFIEVDFVDESCGCRRTIKLETGEDGDQVKITSRSFPKEEVSLEETRVESFSVVKAIAAAVLLLEV